MTTRMDSGFIEDFLTICKGKFATDEIDKMHDGLTTLKRQERKDVARNKENMILNLITKVVQKQDKEQKARNGQPAAREVAQPRPSEGAGSPPAPKQETEAVMEGLMNRIVANPNLIVDETLNSRIENIFNCNAFQRMVEHAEVYPEGLSNASGLSQDNSQLTVGPPEHEPRPKEISRDDSPCFGTKPEDAQRGAAFGTRKGTFAPQPEIETYPNQNQEVKKLSGTPSMKQLEGGSAPPQGEQDKTSSVDLDHEGEEPIPTVGQDVPGVIPEDEPISQILNNDSVDTTAFMNESSLMGQSVGHRLYEKMPAYQRETKDDYVDDNDEGFIVRQATEDDFVRLCKELAKKYNFPERAILAKEKKEEIKMETEEERAARQLALAAQAAIKNDESATMLKTLGKDGNEESKTDKKTSVLPTWVKFPETKNSEFYPVQFDGVIYDCYELRVIYDREKTGFEQTKDFQIVINSIVAGRYQVMEYLGSAAFSKAIQCQDLLTKHHVCMKIIENNKDYLDQSLDEIKLLRFINANCENPDEKNVLRLFDYFYHKEHLFIVTELLRDNLYEFYRYNRDNEDNPYFTIGRLQKITSQILIALDYIHSLHLIHCDLKPENILIKSYSRCEVKVIDFGSSCFIHDHLSSYVQSRSYRAPEVILGCKYDYKIDMWSLGCILAELFTGYVLFQNESIQALLARVLGIIGPIPEHMMMEGQLVPNYFTREGLIYQEGGADDDYSSNSADSSIRYSKRKKDLNQTNFKIHLLIPKLTNLRARLNNTDDLLFLDFVFQLLQIDPAQRPSAKQAMEHPWLTPKTYDDGL